MPRFDDLKKKFGSIEEMAQDLPVSPIGEMSESSPLAQFLSKSAPAAREGVMSALQGESPLKGLQKGWDAPKEAASGYDLASKVGDLTGVDNPYALSALSALAEVGIDPTMINPAGVMGRVGKVARAAGEAEKLAEVSNKAKQMGRRMADIGGISAPVRNEAEAMLLRKALENKGRLKKGSTIRIDEPELPEALRSQSSAKAIPKEEIMPNPTIDESSPLTNPFERVELGNQLFRSLKDKLR